MTLRWKMLVPVGALFAVSVCMVVATVVVSSKQQDDGLVINLAGRQRMLTQKMAKESLLLRNSNASRQQTAPIRAKLDATMAVFAATLHALANSGNAPITLDPAGPQRAVPPPSAEVGAQLAKVEALWGRYHPMVATMAAGDSADPAAFLQSSEAILGAMNTAVGMMQQESENHVVWLLSIQWSLLGIGFLMVIAISIILQRTVIKPIKALATCASHLSRGDLHAAMTEGPPRQP